MYPINLKYCFLLVAQHWFKSTSDDYYIHFTEDIIVAINNRGEEIDKLDVNISNNVREEIIITSQLT